MIFVSVGTEKFPFNRLLAYLDKGVENKNIYDTIFAQIGCSDYRPKNYSYKDYISYSEMVENIQSADMVIMHAGIGSTILSLELGKIPILFPRLFKENEHLDDHQLEFATKFQTVRQAIIAYDEEQLFSAIKNYRSLVCDINDDNAAGFGNLRLDQHLIEVFGG